jgi:hypothetical protein
LLNKLEKKNDLGSLVHSPNSKNLEGGDHLVDLEAVRKIIFKWILQQLGLRIFTGFNWLRILYS